MHHMKVVATLLNALAGAVLLAAATLKWFSGPTERWDVGLHRPLIVAEVLLGLGLLSGVRRKAIERLACICFVVFAGVNIIHVAAGRGSCGCFGSVQVNPWITLALDLLFVVVLGMSAIFSQIEPSRPGHIRLGVTVALTLVLTMIIVWSATSQNAPPAMNRLGTVSGNLVVLEPEHWAGKPFVLADFIPHGEALKTGRWVVLIYHNGCSTCQQALPAFRQALASGAKGSPKIALIEIPPHEDGNLGGWGDLNAALPDNHDWFATTPVAIAVENGIVKATVSGDAAVDADGFLRQAGFGEQ